MAYDVKSHSAIKLQTIRQVEWMCKYLDDDKRETFRRHSPRGEKSTETINFKHLKSTAAIVSLSLFSLEQS